MRVEEPFLTVEGHVSPGFEPVANVFTENFRLGREANAQCCVYVGEDKVVDLWGTSAEAENKNYDGDTLQVRDVIVRLNNPSSRQGDLFLQLVFSTTKTITSIAFASLLDRGLLNYDQTVGELFFLQCLTLNNVLLYQGNSCNACRFPQCGLNSPPTAKIPSPSPT